MVKALARAFRWRKMLDTGVHATLEELARVKGVAPSYVSRVLRLTLLAPEIVEAILDGRQPAELQLDDLLEGFRWSGRGAPSGVLLLKRPRLMLGFRNREGGHAMSIYQAIETAMHGQDPDKYIGLLHDDFKFVRHRVRDHNGQGGHGRHDPAHGGQRRDGGPRSAVPL